MRLLTLLVAQNVRTTDSILRKPEKLIFSVQIYKYKVKHVVIECTIEQLAPRLNGGKSGNIEYIGMSTEQCVRILVHKYTVNNGMPICLPIETQIKLLGARETISVIS